MLRGRAVVLRPATAADVEALVAIRADPEVRRWWRGGDDLTGSVRADLGDDDLHVYAIEHDGRVVGAIQWYAEADPDYRHASLDVFLEPAARGAGLGGDAIRTLARHLIDEYGHHRFTIDPAAANSAAIRAYAKVGFRPVGVLRRYERGEDGRWHDGLLMDLLADDLVE
ncbi:GNAT family protein [Micromonospora zamorensis]|uniref:Aminoglycoside 6'-N-acetyltransferase n=2 Tax=Micromonospora TaxID=1873 RepID=A0A7Y9X8K3_9ACTN|nr:MULTISPECIES: GNAT family protein [Micromonospora]NYH45750.1 aminoglycoside 6'-N-acetyltransferase [Micromonospora jinlongensis]MBQ1039429.1 GNAT family N-acetyltransferase [Micromonospora sp. C81]MCG5467347.1 GNAT family N-acetyltransferase [Micromonospora cabrerizensis]WSK47291.1 GNAT family N-acetyltransferase [Micromonospora zamorensis]WTI18820.1 GNAT family N-acetyltransferase [Micromonospora zamorensis]